MFALSVDAAAFFFLPQFTIDRFSAPDTSSLLPRLPSPSHRKYCASDQPAPHAP